MSGRHWRLVLAGIGLAASAGAATPEPGLWAVDAEQTGQPGRGMQIDLQNGALVLTVYGYRADGSAQWYLSAGPLGATGYSGPLDQYEGGASLGGTVQPARPAGSAGTVTLEFSDSTHGRITLPGESPKAISKLRFGGTPAVTLGDFRGTIQLGAPTGNSIRASVLAADQAGMVSLSLGTTPGIYPRQTPPQPLVAGVPTVIGVDGLSPDTRYYYRLQYQAASGPGSGATPEYSFHTARPPGSSFTFTIQSDSHLDENSDLDQYRRTLANVLADRPDFHVDLGDTFMCEKYSTPLTATLQRAPDPATVNARYAYERTHFGIFGHSTPLFLANGNHEGELGWLANGSENNITVWATRARQQYFLNPPPDGFFTGDSLERPFVGRRAAWYSWTWGDALFLVLDPYWESARSANSDAWNLTLGERQYQWLTQTLAASTARYKFVFLHNLVGGLDGQMRGGVEAAPYFEWGGRNADGSPGFATRRPGWAMPIHDLLVAHRVTAVFHGHDHVYVRQVLDGIVYQAMPQPSARNFSSGANIAADYHYTSGTIVSSSGHLRVSVSPDQVTSEYVRSWLPRNETATRRNGQVDDSWTVR